MPGSNWGPDCPVNMSMQFQWQCEANRLIVFVRDAHGRFLLKDTKPETARAIVILIVPLLNNPVAPWSAAIRNAGRRGAQETG
jgi:hypothetical protein